MRGESSVTARRAALHRAAHQLLESGAVFADPLAVALLGEDPRAIAREAAERPGDRLMRLFIAARSRFAEDRLGEAVARGLRQAVVLGAGLDTFGLRNPHAGTALQVFEMDHPATQAWKLARLADLGLGVPQSLHFAAIDFERQNIMAVLAGAGFRRDEPAFFIWLGVVPYLTRAAIFETLAAIGKLPDAEVVFDYGEPPEAYPPERRASLARRMERVAALGEPWISFFDPADLAQELRKHGFDEIEDLGFDEIAQLYFGEVPLPHGAGGGHVLRARRAAP
jgi:methyltransferase (TIGR00027 family)